MGSITTLVLFAIFFYILFIIIKSKNPTLEDIIKTYGTIKEKEDYQKSDNQIIDNFFLGFWAFLKIIVIATLIISFIYSLYSAIANIIHFNIWTAILWTIGAIVLLILFLFIRILINPFN